MTKEQTHLVTTKVAEFHRDGLCLLRNFIATEKLRTWSEAFQPLLSKHIQIQADASFRGVDRHYVTLPFRAPFADPEIFDNDLIIEIVEQIVGKDFVMCQLASDTPMLGSSYQDIHADAPPLFPGLPDNQRNDTPSFQLALNFPLCDVTLENGPTEIARGTHRMEKTAGLLQIETGAIQLEAIEMKMGDVMLRDVRGLHRGTPNTTMQPRPMIVIGYSRKWLHRPEVSIQIPRGSFTKLSPRAQNMLRFNPLVDRIDEALQIETYKSFAY